MKISQYVYLDKILPEDRTEFLTIRLKNSYKIKRAKLVLLEIGCKSEKFSDVGRRKKYFRRTKAHKLYIVVIGRPRGNK